MIGKELLRWLKLASSAERSEGSAGLRHRHPLKRRLPATLRNRRIWVCGCSSFDRFRTCLRLDVIKRKKMTGYEYALYLEVDCFLILTQASPHLSLRILLNSALETFPLAARFVVSVCETYWKGVISFHKGDVVVTLIMESKIFDQQPQGRF